MITSTALYFLLYIPDKSVGIISSFWTIIHTCGLSVTHNLANYMSMMR